MKIVECSKDFARNGMDFKSGHMYVMADDVESQLRSISGDCMGMSHPIEMMYKKYNGENLSGKRLICWRTGGVGDLHFLIPVLRHLKKRYPGCFLRVASGCKEPLENLPEIDELYSMPFDAKLLQDVDYALMFQGIIESSSEASKVTHAVDMFFSYFNIDSTHLPVEDKRPRLVFTTDEMKWLKEECGRLKITDKDYVVGIQMESSSPLRNYPKEKFKIVVDVLVKEENVKILLIGCAQQALVANFLKGNYPNVIAATNYSVRQSIVLANRYNVVISSDSFMVQTAGALEKPLIGIYGPFSSEVRMKYFKNAVGLEAKVVCSPCYKHDFRPCIKGFPSPCFSLVTPREVLEAVDYFKNKFCGGHFGYMTPLMQKPNFADAEQYFLSADKGLCFFGGYFKHHNMIHVDKDLFCKPDISDLNTGFQRGKYPFVVYMDMYDLENGSIYNNAKELVRPGGFFVAWKQDANEQFFLDIKKDIGRSYVLLFSKFDPPTRTMLIAGRRPL